MYRTCPTATRTSSTRAEVPVAQARAGMAGSDDVTRVLFQDFAPGTVRLFYAIGYSAIAVFCYGVYTQVRKYRRGVPAGIPLNLLPRLESMLAIVLNHRMIARRDHNGRRGAPPDLLWLRAAVLRHGHHHARLRHRRSAVRRALLARRVLSLVLAGARHRRRHAGRRPALHDVSARLAQAAQARLRAAGPRAHRSRLRPQRLPARGLGVSLDPADHRHYRLRARGAAAGVAAEPAGCLEHALVVAGRVRRWLQRMRAARPVRDVRGRSCGATCGGSTGCWRCCSLR